MTTIANMIDEYNAIAREINEREIASFKGAKHALQTRIDEIRARRDAMRTNDDDDDDTHVANTFRIADIAREFNKNAKILRARVRRLNLYVKHNARNNVFHIDAHDDVCRDLNLID